MQGCLTLGLVHLPHSEKLRPFLLEKRELWPVVVQAAILLVLPLSRILRSRWSCEHHLLEPRQEMAAVYRPGPDTEGVVSSQDRTHAAFGNVSMSTYVMAGSDVIPSHGQS